MGREIDDCLVRFIPWYFIPWYITEENILTDRLENKIQQYKQDLEKIVDIGEVFGILTLSNKKTKFQLEEDSFIDLLDSCNVPNYEHLLDEHLVKYAFTTTYLLLPLDPLSKGELRIRLKQAVDLDYKGDYNHRLSSTKKKLKKQEKLLEIACRDEEFLECALLSRELSFFFTAGVEDSFEVFSRILPIMKKIAQRIKIDYHNLVLLRSQEIIDLLVKPEKLSEINLAERKIGYFMVQKDGSRSDYFGNRALELTKMINRQKKSSADIGMVEFAGYSAQKGKVIGKVFIAHTAQEAIKITKENILVTSMTTPDYVQAMKKSLAIITNEGGVLCHAAIISREFGIPCIIGTKIATQALKDGDLVEVDADHGIVRILERVSNTVEIKKKLENDELITELAQDTWRYIGQWQQPVVSNSLWCYWHTSKSTQLLFPTIEFSSFLNPNCQFWLRETDIEKFNQFGRLLVGHNTGISEFSELVERVGNSLKSEAESFDTTDLMGRDYARELFRIYKELIGFWTSVWMLGDELGHVVVDGGTTEKDLLDYVVKHTKSTELEKQAQSVSIISDRVRAKISSVSENRVREIIGTDPKICDMTTRHLEKYPWFGTHHWLGKEYDLGDLVSEIVNYTPPGTTKETSDVIAQTPILDLITQLTYWRTRIAEISCELVFGARGFLTNFANSLGMEYEELLFLSDEEIVGLFDSMSTLDCRSLIANRKVGYGSYLDSNTGLKVFHPNECEMITHLMRPQTTHQKSQLQGTVASGNGSIAGVVCVVLSPTDIGGFQDGNILVAPETTPDFVPIMRRAKAVITDRGGITSHAAIICREIGVPCIIGTQFATQALNDDDVVELNLESGEVVVIL
jgi:phosphohistidine swiveling domain-containing protein